MWLQAEARVSRLTSEQQEIVSAWGQGMSVVAGAGCGKTTTLVWKVRELLRRDPQAKFAAVSFTEKSAADLKEKLSKELALENGSDAPLKGHLVTTIHGLCASVIRDFPQAADLSGEEVVLAEAEAR